MKYNIAILKSEAAYDHLPWIEACKRNSSIQTFDIIELAASNWMTSVFAKNYDLFLLRPPGQLESFKRLYDERVYILSTVLGLLVYPSLNEILIYENKRFLRDWLDANDIPHPKTQVFYNEKEAVHFLNGLKTYPLIAKTNIGSSGDGVVLLESRRNALAYVQSAFNEGIKTRSGFKLSKGSMTAKLKKLFTRKDFIKNRLREYIVTSQRVQNEFVILQEFIPHDFEWRCVKIGDSFFAHKKIAVKNQSSGSLKKGYGPVPYKLLDFIKKIASQTSLTSVAIDVFERDEEYLVNEIQCFFGQSDPYQMLVDGKPGRYRLIGNNWEFEEGMFNTNQSFDLRLDRALKLIPGANC